MEYLGINEEIEPIGAALVKPVPEVNIEAAVAELKKYLDEKKFDLVDYSLVNIECYPPSDSDEYPELKSFAAQWTAAFDYAEKVTVNDNGEGFPEDVIEKFETKTHEIMDALNSDTAYWTELRSIILPLYEKSKFFSDWKRRWQKAEVFYDPIGLEATTTEIFTNKKTGERIRGDVVRSTEYKPGFVIKIDGKYDVEQSESVLE